MSVKSSRVLRSALCLVLAVLMALGTCVTAFAAESEETINYVSLGDSMTNGYGLTGYGNNGHNSYGAESYANQFADWLEDVTGKTVDHSQLAVSALRTEDLHWILEYPNGYAGDTYTVNNFINNRFDNDNGFANVEKAAEEYQTAVANANIISVGTGNANFGVFLMYSAMDALGALGDTEDGYAWVKFEDALGECDAATKAFAVDTYEMIKAKLLEDAPAEATDMLTKVADRMAYVFVSYVLNYGGVLEALVELNPKAEIIIVGLMNSMNGVTIDCVIEGEAFELPVGEIMNAMIGSVNTYLAALPATLQAGGKYPEATFYFAEEPNVEVIANVLTKDMMQDADSVVRDRTIGKIVEIVWPLLNAMTEAAGDGSPYIDITDDDVAAYEAALDNAVTFGLYMQGNATKLQSIATYLAFEDAAIAASNNEGNLNGAALLKLMDMDALGAGFEGVYTQFEANLCDLEFGENASHMQFANNFRGLENTVYSLVALPDAMSAALLADEHLASLLNLFARMMVGDGIGCHPSAAGHNALAEAVIEAYEQKVTVDQVVEEKATAALTELVALLKEYGPEYADEAWNYAVEQGYVAAAQAAIDEMLLAAEAELEAFMADPEGYVTAASAELQAQLAALKTALAESEHELADDLLVQIEALETQLADLYAQLETATGEVKVQLEAAITEIENAIAALEAEAAALEADIAAITAEIEAIEADIIALGEQTAAIGEKLVSLVDQAEAMKGSLETLVAEGPEALEENIDAVVTQIETAVETIVTIAGEVEEAVAAAEELAASIDSAIDTVVAAIEARIGSYAETLETIADTLGTGLAPVVEALNALAEGAGELAEEAAAAIAAHEAEIAAILAAAEEAAAAIRAEYAEEIAALELAVAEKKAELETKLAELETAVSEELTARKAELEAQITDLQAQLEAKKAELEGAAEEVKAEIQAAIAEIETAIADAEAALAEVEAEIQAAVAEIEAAIEEIEAAIADAEAALAEKVAEVEAAVSEIIAEAEAKAAELQAEIDELLAEAGEQIDAAVKEAAAALVEEIAKVSEEAAAAVEAALAEGVTGVEALIDEAAAAAAAGAEELVTYVEEQLNTLAETVQAYVDEFAAEIEQAYQNATTGEYEINSANYYVSLGDDSAVSQSFVDELAAELGVDYKNLAAAGTTPEDLLAALAAGDEAYIAEIAKADLITVSYNPATFATTQVEKLTGNQALEEMDWAAYVGEEGTVYVDEALAELDAYLAEAGITGNYADIVSTVVESYAYSVMSFAANYAVMVDAIHEISPNAEVIILGSYNAFNDVEFVMGADVLPLGEGMEALTELANAYLLAYAAIAENTTYVDITDTDTELELSGRMEIDVADPYVLIEVFTMLQNLGGTVTPTADGHTYIKNQILGVETIIEPDGLLGDVTLDGVIDIRDVQALFDHVMGYETLTGIALKNADVNEDGSVNIIDVQALFEIVMTN